MMPVWLRLVPTQAARRALESAIFSFSFKQRSVTGSVARLESNVTRTARGVIVADLLRARRAYAWIWFLTLFTNPMVRHDARVSVAQALNRGEVTALRDRAGLQFADFHKHFGHRFVLAGHKRVGV